MEELDLGDEPWMRFGTEMQVFMHMWDQQGGGGGFMTVHGWELL